MDQAMLKDVLQWDVGNWITPLNYWEKVLDDTKTSLTCLELGAREGGLSLWLASKGHSVVCSDLTNTEAIAFPLHKKYNLLSKISYRDIDATTIPYENHFDVVVIKSILGGIGRNNNLSIQKQVIDQVYKALKPGGRFLFAENSKATVLHRFFRKKFTKWGSDWRYLSQEDFHDLLSSFNKAHIKSTGFAGVFGRSESQKILLSKSDKYFLNHILPQNWKYIVYGSAVK